MLKRIRTGLLLLCLCGVPSTVLATKHKGPQPLASHKGFSKEPLQQFAQKPVERSQMGQMFRVPEKQQQGQQGLQSSAPSSPSAKSEAFIRLQQTLEEDGFQILFQRPPKRNTYGMLEIQTRKIWINPVVFDLGNAEATLVHEAVHAAQLCASGQPLRSLGLSISSDKRLRRYYLRYQGARRPIEAEAYSIQVHPQKVSQAISLLQKHCP